MQVWPNAVTAGGAHCWGDVVRDGNFLITASAKGQERLQWCLIWPQASSGSVSHVCGLGLDVEFFELCKKIERVLCICFKL